MVRKQVRLFLSLLTPMFSRYHRMSLQFKADISTWGQFEGGEGGSNRGTKSVAHYLGSLGSANDRPRDRKAIEPLKMSIISYAHYFGKA